MQDLGSISPTLEEFRALSGDPEGLAALVVVLTFALVLLLVLLASRRRNGAALLLLLLLFLAGLPQFARELMERFLAATYEVVALGETFVSPCRKYVKNVTRRT